MCYRNPMSESKINQIEEVLAHQEQQINDLSEMLIAQNDEINLLKKDILKLQGKVDDMGEDAPTADQKPPHY